MEGLATVARQNLGYKIPLKRELQEVFTAVIFIFGFSFGYTGWEFVWWLNFAIWFFHHCNSHVFSGDSKEWSFLFSVASFVCLFQITTVWNGKAKAGWQVIILVFSWFNFLLYSQDQLAAWLGM